MKSTRSRMVAGGFVAFSAIAIGAAVVLTLACDNGNAARTATRESRAIGALFITDDTREGRLRLTRTDCSGDGTLIGSFEWSRVPGLEDQPHRIEISPWENAPYLAFRVTTGGQQRLGGFAPGREYTITVYRPQSPDVWAAGTLIADTCDAYAAPCPPDAPAFAQGPVTGAVTHNQAMIWLRTCASNPVSIEYKKRSEDWDDGVRTSPVTADESRDHTAVVTLPDLDASTPYDYRLLLGGELADHPAAGFTTGPSPGAPAQFRFVSTGDMHQISVQHRPLEATALFANMLAQDPHLTLLLGDNIDVDGYGSFTPMSAEAYYRHYRDNWSFAPLRALMAAAPTYAMWDDHDILNDWDRREAAPYPFARTAFDDFIGQHNPPPARAGTTYFSFDVGDVSFFMLDTRSYRDPNRDPDGSEKSMLGPAQKDELKAWLLRPGVKFRFITSGVPWDDHQVVPLKQFDGWDGFQVERQELFDFIGGNAVAGVVLLSADNHWPMVTRHPHGIVEFKTTPAVIDSSGLPEAAKTDPNVLYYGLTNAFGRFDVDTTTSPPRVSFAMFDANGLQLYDLTLTNAGVEE